MVSEQIDKGKLKAIRESRHLTQGQLAVKSGVAQSIISRIERGVITNIRLSTARQLADALGVEISDLMVAPSPPADPIDLTDPSLRIHLSAIGELPPEDQRTLSVIVAEFLRRNRERRQREGSQ